MPPENQPCQDSKETTNTNHPEPLEPAVPVTNTPPRELRSSRYPCRIPIRMTPGERAIIGRKATALNLSISRFLVESGVSDKPGYAADPARLRYLQVLFQDAADKAKALLASPLFAVKNELNSEVKMRLEEAAYLLKALAGELARRLS